MNLRRNNKHWLPIEDQLLTQLHNEGKNVSQMAEQLCRTETSVRMRRQKLGLFKILKMDKRNVRQREKARAKALEKLRSEWK